MGTYDVIVIGGGPGGYSTAIRAAKKGKTVCLVEKNRLGGTCLNRGCIPTKAMAAMSVRLKELKENVEYGINLHGYTVDFARGMARRNAIVEQLVNGLHLLFKKNKITLTTGTAQLLGGGRVMVTLTEGRQTELKADNIVIATGSEPALISSLGYNAKNIVTSNEILQWTEIPESILIVGGGVIGCEFASIFNALGARVTVVEAMPTILPMLDSEIARRMQGFMKEEGITIKTGTTIKNIVNGESMVKAVLENGEEPEAARVLLSVGRVLNTKGLGLEDTGVLKGSKGEVIIDEFCRTNIDGIYAVGDITGKSQLAHMAYAQGHVAASHIAGEDSGINFSAVPNCIYTIPEAASVGLTSQEAQARGLSIKIGRFPFNANGKALCLGEGKGLVKIIADGANDKVLGVHILGAHATELVSEAVLAIRMGATIQELATTIHAHPTLSEAVLEAAEAVHGMALHS